MSSRMQLGARFDREPGGDCANSSCLAGRIDWQRWSGPSDIPPLHAGACERCGQWAAQCPVCGDLVALGEEFVECSCELNLRLAPGGPRWRIELITPDDVRRTYALPDK